MNPEEFYKEQYNKYELTLNREIQKSKMVSIFRLVSFLLIIVSIVCLTVIEYKTLAWIGIISSFVTFLILIKYQLSLEKQKKSLNHLLRINKQELESIVFQFTENYDAQELSDYKHAFASDLNILGRASLFQYINRCVTKLGQEKLISQLLKPSTDPIYITELQNRTKELSKYPEWRQQFQSQGKMYEDAENLNSFNNWLHEESIFYNRKALRLFVEYLPIVAISALLFGIFSGIYVFAELLFSLQAILVLIQVKSINRIHEKLGNMFKLLNVYSELMKLIESKSFESKLLIDAQNKLCRGNANASSEVKKLSKIVNRLDRRLNILVAFFLNTTYMADLRTVFELEKWKVKNKLNLKVWIDALSEFDTAISFSTFAFNNPHYTYPQITNKHVINAVNLGHPLISPEKRVCNDFAINSQGQFVILTGANMAGKSTFLRTVGINLVLAMNGASVCATSFSFKPLPVFTSISVKDSLFDNESYFYAELLRLKMIIDKLEAGEELFILLDEILKGTNSNDKFTGSRQLMQKIIKYKAAGIVATHDIALGDLEKELPENILNKSFEISIDNDRLYYDYKLQTGICQNLNASYLMRKMGITS